jgi:hypothetical protein
MMNDRFDWSYRATKENTSNTEFGTATVENKVQKTNSDDERTTSNIALAPVKGSIQINKSRCKRLIPLPMAQKK